MEFGSVDHGGVVFRFPVTLHYSQPCILRAERESNGARTHSKELAQARVVGLAGLALGVLEVLGQPEADDLEHAVEGFVRGADGDEGIGGVEVGPVFQVRGGFEQLRRERESN